MRSWMGLFGAAVMALVLLVGGLWAWQEAGDVVADWRVARPDMVAWAVRSAAVAAAALAEVICLRFVAGRLYPRRIGDELLRLSAAVVCVLAVVSAVALGLAGR